MMGLLRRQPYLSASLALHAALLALAWDRGLFQHDTLTLQDPGQKQAVASSLRATQQASLAQRLQDLQTIKSLLEQSAESASAEHQAANAAKPPADKPTAPGRKPDALDPTEPPDVQAAPEPPPAPSLPAAATPQAALAQAQELAQSIQALGQQLEAQELARLTGTPPPDRSASASATDSTTASASTSESASPAASVPGAAALADISPEQAQAAMAALETQARATLARRLARLDAREQGVPVNGTGEVRARMAAFMGDGHDKARPTARYGWFGYGFFDHGAMGIPAVPAATVQGQGRVFGPGGEFANRVSVNGWYIIGPFEGRHGAGLFNSPAHPPELAVLLDAVYVGKGQRLVRWRYVPSSAYPLQPPDMAEDSVYYGYTEVHMDRARDLLAWIGADDDVQIRLNDQLVWKGGNVNKGSYFGAIFGPDRESYLRDMNRTEGQRLLHFRQGRNRLFFKLSNGPNQCFLSFVLTPQPQPAN